MNSKEYLKKAKIVVSIPIKLKIKMGCCGTYDMFPATRGEWAIPIRKVYHYVKLVKKEIAERINKEGMTSEGLIKEWLDGKEKSLLSRYYNKKIKKPKKIEYRVHPRRWKW